MNVTPFRNVLLRTEHGAEVEAKEEEEEEESLYLRSKPHKVRAKQKEEVLNRCRTTHHRRRRRRRRRRKRG
jgi:hypothetical protein